MQIPIHPKLITLLLTSVFFSVLYIFLDDNNFSGVNFVKETIKKEVIKKKIKSEIQKQPDEVVEIMSTIDDSAQNRYMQYIPAAKTDVAIADATKEIAHEVKIDDDDVAETINVSTFQHMFNRVYFSLNTSCLLGYGDIYPVTNIAKSIAILQALTTVSIIVF